MTQKTSIKSATWTDLDEIRTALPGIPIDDARALLHSSRARFLSSGALAARGKAAADRIAKKTLWSSNADANAPRAEFTSPVFAKRTARISGEVSDHTLRLSDSRNDSAAMKKFLETKTITVVPTRNAPGVKAQTIRAKFGSPVSSGARSRKAHSKVAREAADARRS